MSREIVFEAPEHIINVPLDDDAGAIVAAHQAMGRFTTALSRGDAEFEERVFTGLSTLARESQVDDLFVVVPPPPELGALGVITLRYYAGARREDIDDLVNESAGGERFVLEQPDVSVRATRMGDATRNLLRYTVGEAPKPRRIRKSDLRITEQLSWYWYLEDPDGSSAIINLTSLSHELDVAVLIRPVIDRFATERISFA